MIFTKILNNYKEVYLDKVEEAYYKNYENLLNKPNVKIVQVNRETIVKDPEDINSSDPELANVEIKITYTYGEVYNNLNLDEDLDKIKEDLIKDGAVVPTLDCYKEEVLRVLSNLDSVFPYPDNKFNDYIVDYLKQNTMEIIKPMLKDKTDEIRNILVPGITKDQEDRYRAKFRLANEAINTDDYSKFENEAKVRGVTPKDLVDSIIKIGKPWLEALDHLDLNLETVRAYFNIKSKQISNIDDSLILLEDINKIKQIEISTVITDLFNIKG